MWVTYGAPRSSHPTVTLIRCIKPGEILKTDNIYIIYIDISIVWVYLIGDKGIIRLQPRQSEPVVKDLIDALVF